MSQNNYTGRHSLSATWLECRFHRLALMCSSSWFMEKPGFYKDSKTGCFHGAWDSRQTLEWKHDAALVVEGAIDGWMGEMLSSQDSLLPQRRREEKRRLKRIPQNGCIPNFPSGNKPLKIHTGDSLGSQQSPPPLLRKHVYAADPSSSQTPNPQVKLESALR